MKHNDAPHTEVNQVGEEASELMNLARIEMTAEQVYDLPKDHQPPIWQINHRKASPGWMRRSHINQTWILPNPCQHNPLIDNHDMYLEKPFLDKP